MKHGIGACIRDKTIFTKTNGLFVHIGQPITLLNRAKTADFIYLKDMNNSAINKDIYDKITYQKPLIVETSNPSLITYLNEIEAHVCASNHHILEKAKKPVSLLPFHYSKAKFFVAKEPAQLKTLEANEIKKTLVFEKEVQKAYGVIKWLKP